MIILVSNVECCQPPFSFAFHSEEVKQSILAIQSSLRQRQAYLGDMMILRSFRNRIQYIDYSFNEFGKPSLKYRSHLHFSKSHCHDYVITVASEYNVGIDIERYDEKMIRIKDKFLSDIEEGFLASSKNKEKFLRDTWVIKESYAKLIGVGLLINFRKINIDYQKGIIRYGENHKAYFKLLTLFNEYSVAISTLQEIKEPLKIKAFSLQEYTTN